MVSLGYSDADLITGYDEDAIIDMLEEGKPVFIAAVSGAIHGHAWVIDGLIRQRNGDSMRDFMHCKFGWGGGDCNGYYSSGLFNLEEGPESYDDEFETGLGTKDRNYKKFYRIITY